MTMLLKRNIKKIKNAIMHDTDIEELLKGSSTALILKTFGMICGYIFVLLIARIYGADVVGVFALSVTLLTIFSVIGKLGFDIALLRFVADYSAQNRMDLVKEVYIKSLRIIIPFSLFLSFLLFTSSSYLAKSIFKKDILTIYFRMVSFAIIPMVFIFINTESLRGLKRIREYALLQNVSISLFAVLLFVLLRMLYTSHYMPLIAYIISLFMVFILSLMAWLKYAEITTNVERNELRIRNILNVSIPMFFSSSLYLIMEWTDTVMLGMMREEHEVGIYNIAIKLATIMMIMLVAVNSYAAPKFAALYGSGDMEGLKRIAQHSSKLIFWTSFPVFLIFFIFPSLILQIFGNEFKAGVYALLMLTCGQFINVISGSAGYLLQMTGKQKIFRNIILGATVINVLMNALLIPRYGINGAALASAVSLVSWNVCSLFFIKIHFNFTTLYLPMLKR
jgi:O-antigen/teichoic acid export membrane protein